MDHSNAEAPAGKPAPPKSRRRIYLVDRRFQLKYAALLTGAGLAAALVFGAWVWQAHRQTIDLLVADPALRAVLEAGDLQLLAVFLGIAVTLALALGLVGVVLTHHVAGPVHVMSHYLAALAEGRYPRMRPLRRRDELQGFFELFERAVRSLRDREARHAAVSEGVLERMREATAKVPELRPALEALEALVREEREAVGADPAG